MAVGRTWVLDPSKFFSEEDTRQIRDFVCQQRDGHKKSKTSWRRWMIIEMAFETGARVSEISSLCCGDIFADSAMAGVFVRRGKGGKARYIRVRETFVQSLKEFISWKRLVGEGTEAQDPLFWSVRSKGPTSVRAIQKAFKSAVISSGVNPELSIHRARHTYASKLYQSSNYNLRLVQKQLGHSSIKTTEVYADVLAPDLKMALERLYSDEV